MAITAATISRTIRTCFIVGTPNQRWWFPFYCAQGTLAQEPEIWLCSGVEQTPETFENVADAVAGELEGVCGNVEYAVGRIFGDVERAVNNLVGVLGYCSGDVRRDLGGYDLCDDFHHFVFLWCFAPVSHIMSVVVPEIATNFLKIFKRGGGPRFTVRRGPWRFWNNCTGFAYYVGTCPWTCNRYSIIFSRAAARTFGGSFFGSDKHA